MGTHSAGHKLPEPSTLLMPLLALLGKRSISLLTKKMDTPGIVSAMARATDATGTRTGGERRHLHFASQGLDMRVDMAASPPVAAAAAFFLAAATLAGWVQLTATLPQATPTGGNLGRHG